MSIPPQDVLDDINDLIREITGFQENDENYSICQRYCISHVVHHTYPFVNRTTMKTLIDSFVSRFNAQGYFKVSQELQRQVEYFLSNKSLFEKNLQYDIQWSLLGLLSSLSANLTAVKSVPELLPINIKEIKADDIDWLKYLNEDLPNFEFPVTDNSNDDCDNDDDVDDDDERELASGLEEKANEHDKTHSLFSEEPCPEIVAGKSSISQLEKSVNCDDEKMVNERKNQVQELIKSRLSAISLVNDYEKWGNISEKLDNLLRQEGVYRKSQLLSELEMMEYILYQLQTGEKIFLKKGITNPALISVTQTTLGNYLDSLQPYFHIIRLLKDFNSDIIKAKYPELNQISKINLNSNEPPSHASESKRKSISNVLYVYSQMIDRALASFQNRIMDIIENLGNYSLIRMQRDIQCHFFELTSIFYIHGLATKNWKSGTNWICSIRVLAVLYNAIMSASSMKMSFLFLNMFLPCFRVYLDIIDSWISLLALHDPNEEFIIAKSTASSSFDGLRMQLEIRPYKIELTKAGIKEIPVLDFIAEKMIEVGESLEVLRRLGRFSPENVAPKESSYESLIALIDSKLNDLVKTVPESQVAKPQEKKRNIFTMSNSSVTVPARDTGQGDCLRTENDSEKAKERNTDEKGVGEKCDDHCADLINSTMSNPYFRKAFENVGIKHQLRKLEKIKGAEKLNENDFNLDLIKIPASQTFGAVYPYYKIIFESCCRVIESRVGFTYDLVKNIIIDEMNLKNHLSLMRSFLLFNDSYLVQSFVFAFFTEPVVWSNTYLLNFYLRECLEVRFKNLAPRFSMHTRNSKDYPKNVLQAIDNLGINYEVEWPLTLILTPKIMIMLTGIFRLALKLKWAHWILANLRFRGDENVQRGPLKHIHHRLHLLRFWFLSSLTQLNNYFVAQMSLPDPDFDSCKNLMQITRVYSGFVEKIYRNCLLGDKARQTWSSLIFQTLIPLCVDLERCWKGESVVSSAELTSMENAFASCQMRLRHLLSSLDKNDFNK